MSVVTISRGTMSGGRALAECLAERLGASCLGREILIDAAARMGVSHDLLRAKMEKSPGLLEIFSSERRTYLLAVKAALADRVLAGNLVYHGQAGHLLLRGLPGVLRIRLIAAMPSRIHAIMERDAVSREEAESRIRRLDLERARWTHFMYGVEIGDPGLYDLVVNLEVLTIASACEVVLHALTRPEFSITDGVLARLRNFAAGCRTELEAHQVGKPAAAAQARARVLVVDDEIELATRLAERLGQRGYDATAVFSGKEALMSLDESWYDVVLLDLQLPGMDGIATLRRIRGLHRETQVVVLSGHSTVAQGIEGMQLGAADFLQKPVDIDVLCASVDTAAAKTRENRSHGGQVWR